VPSVLLGPVCLNNVIYFLSACCILCEPHMSDAYRVCSMCALYILRSTCHVQCLYSVSHMYFLCRLCFVPCVPCDVGVFHVDVMSVICVQPVLYFICYVYFICAMYESWGHLCSVSCVFSD
jgi:hypothetical protein